MSVMAAADLLAAYRATRYEICWGGDVLVARIGAPASEVDALLDRLDARSGVFVTAWNPRSERQPRRVNDAADRRLKAWLAGRLIPWLPHLGAAEDGSWAERGVFALDLPREAAVALARRFDQLAVVRIARDRAAEIILANAL